jgi:hypothetical protein
VKELGLRCETWWSAWAGAGKAHIYVMMEGGEYAYEPRAEIPVWEEKVEVMHVCLRTRASWGRSV